MNPKRRMLLMSTLGASTWAGQAQANATGPAASSVQRGAVLSFPRDHGAHLAARTEWWYLTGWLGNPGAVNTPTHGFQLTFFRSATGLPPVAGSRFSAPHLLFAHAAVTELPTGRHHHAQKLARFSGQPDAPLGAAAQADTRVHLGAWQLRRTPSAAQPTHSIYTARCNAGPFELQLSLQAPLAPLLQGEAGWSRKGPSEQAASHYITEPQLQATGQLSQGARATPVQGKAWLDHEWSDQILGPDVVGWDWIGMNLFDGSALTLFQLRRRDGRREWAGGSWRGPGQARAENFTPEQVAWAGSEPWRSPVSGAAYPLRWRVNTPAGAFEVQALAPAQEIDSRASTGAFYWEGLSELREPQGQRVGLGYLEMTGYAGALHMG
jgi:predicted secreted hydrolase